MYSGQKRAAKPPFYRNVFVRHPVNPVLPLGRDKVAALRLLEPCIVMGRGHSGTRLVAWLCHYLGVEMGTDPQTVPSGDPAEISFKHHQRVVATHSLDVTSPEQVRTVDLTRFQKSVHGFCRRQGLGSAPWGWKFPETYLIGPYVERTFPRARYIHLMRDGRDVAFKRHLTDVPEHRLARAILRRQRAMDLPHHVQAALSWAFQVEHFARFRMSIPSDRILELRYETLVREPLRVTREICHFLGLAMTSGARDFVDNGISSVHAEVFRREDANKVREVEAHIGDTLRRYGYLAE